MKHEGTCYGCDGASFYTKVSLSPCGRWLLGGGGSLNSGKRGVHILKEE